nr:hypothetical protein [Tanacetum cinerariifolium]
TRDIQHGLDRIAACLQLEHSWRVDFTCQRNEAASRRNVDRVTILELDVCRLVTLGDECIHVQLGRDLAASFDLHVAHTTVRVRTAAGEQGGYKGRKA